jgi:hypothetical protein
MNTPRDFPPPEDQSAETTLNMLVLILSKCCHLKTTIFSKSARVLRSTIASHALTTEDIWPPYADLCEGLLQSHRPSGRLQPAE